MPTVKELRDSLNELINKDNENSELDIFVLVPLRKDIDDVITISIKSLVIRSDENDDDKFVGFRLDGSYVEIISEVNKYIDEKLEEAKGRVDKICVQ